MLLSLQIVIASTRPGRAGEPIGQWFAGHCRADGRFAVAVTDLAELALPMLDEPQHPRARQYAHEHTRSWSRTVDAADCLVFVMPEYNHGFSAPLKNAIDYLHGEWEYKPVGLVSYGGVAAGTRAAQMIKQVVTALKMVPLADAVSIPFVHSLINEDDELQPNGVMVASSKAMLDELRRVSDALQPLRQRAE